MWHVSLLHHRRVAPGRALSAPPAATRPWPFRPAGPAVRRVFRRGLLTLWLCAAPAAARADVLLNELLADPARDWNGSGALSSRDDEWVEIINTGPTTVDLAHFRLAGPDSIWRYEFSGALAPGQVHVVYGRQSYDWETANGFPAFGLRMSNSGGELMLFELVGAVPVLRDCYTWLDHEAEDDRSSGRGPDGGTDWLLFDALNPYAGASEPQGSGCAPSPGARLSCATPVQAGTWSTLKALYGVSLR